MSDLKRVMSREEFRIYAWRAFREIAPLRAQLQEQRLLLRAANHVEGEQWARPGTATWDALRVFHDAIRRLEADLV